MARWISPLLLVLASVGAFVLVHPATRPDPERIYDRAERSYLAHDFAAVERGCRQVLLLRPDHGPSRVLLHEVQYVLKLRPPTQEDYGRYWESKFGISRSQGTEIVLRRAERALAEGNAAEAEDDYRRVLASLNESPRGGETNRQTLRALAGIRKLNAPARPRRRRRGRPPPAC
jgi:hypothetical protein